jgi:glutathione synthase/RimK-type ligase-like ATP-grasp enzyme
VVKPNEGTGGVDVFRVSTNAELEAAVTAVFSHHSALAISPYYEIEKEYRVILLNGTALLVYSKDIPMLTGDGQSTVWQLILGQYKLKIPSRLFLLKSRKSS